MGVVIICKNTAIVSGNYRYETCTDTDSVFYNSRTNATSDYEHDLNKGEPFSFHIKGKPNRASRSCGICFSPIPFTIAKPSIKIKKLISVDGGATFENAQTPPGPLLSPGIKPKFKFVVSNNGDVTLKNIKVIDSLLGFVGTKSCLAPGESFVLIPQPIPKL